MGRRHTLSRKERRAFAGLVRMYSDYEARDPAAGETGPPIPLRAAPAPDSPPPPRPEDHR